MRLVPSTDDGTMESAFRVGREELCCVFFVAAKGRLGGGKMCLSLTANMASVDTGKLLGGMLKTAGIKSR